MNQPTDPTPAPPPPAPRLSGKWVVAALVLVILAAVAFAVRLRYQNRERIARGHQAMIPLRARINLLCTDPSQPRPVDLRERGRCTDAGSLDVSLTDTVPEVQQVSWVLLGQDALVAGQLLPADVRTVPLKGLAPGPHLFDFIVTSKPIDLTRITSAVEKAPEGDVPARLLAAEKAASELRGEGLEVRTERLNFRVEDSRVIH